jgi:hypothetical protein
MTGRALRGRTSRSVIALAILTAFVLLPAPAFAEEKPSKSWARNALVQTRGLDTVEAAFTLTIDSTQGSRQVAIDGSLDYENAIGRTVLTGQPGLEAVIITDRTWLRIDDPKFVQLLPAGKEFVEFTTSELLESGIVSLDRETFVGVLYALLGARKTSLQIVSEGRQYHCDLDFARARKQMPRPWLPAFKRAFSGSNLNKAAATCDVLVDAAGWIRSAAIDVSTPTETVAINVTLDHINEPVTVEAPSAEVVVNIEAVPAVRIALSLPDPSS